MMSDTWAESHHISCGGGIIYGVRSFVLGHLEWPPDGIIMEACRRICPSNLHRRRDSFLL